MSLHLSFPCFPSRMKQILAKWHSFYLFYQPVRIQVTNFQALQKLMDYFNKGLNLTSTICRSVGLQVTRISSSISFVHPLLTSSGPSCAKIPISPSPNKARRSFQYLEVDEARIDTPLHRAPLITRRLRRGDESREFHDSGDPVHQDNVRHSSGQVSSKVGDIYLHSETPHPAPGRARVIPISGEVPVRQYIPQQPPLLGIGRRTLPSTSDLF